MSMEKVYYNRIVTTKGEYSVADISTVAMQKKVVTYAKTKLIGGKISQEDYDAWFAPYEEVLA